jgi:hypothetical protein
VPTCSNGSYATNLEIVLPVHCIRREDAKSGDETMNGKQYTFDWSFALQWLVTVAFGAAIGFLAGFMVLWTLGETAERAAGETVAALLGGALFGTLVSLGANVGPALLLARRGIPAQRWLGASIVVTATSMGLGMALTWPVLEQGSDAATIAFMGITLGAPQGIIQSLLLRRWGDRATLWAVISTAAYLVAVAALVRFSGGGTEWLAMSSSGLLLGTLSAAGAAWLLRDEPAALAI